MIPTIGRIVHYTSYGTPGGEYQAECRAAIITELGLTPESPISIAVLSPSGMFFDRGVVQDEGEAATQTSFGRPRAGGTWHWPEREDDTTDTRIADNITSALSGLTININPAGLATLVQVADKRRARR